MYWTPCARLMKSMTPKTSVSPAAIRNSSTPNCSPFSNCTMRRVADIASARGRRLRDAALEGGEQRFVAPLFARLVARGEIVATGLPLRFAGGWALARANAYKGLVFGAPPQTRPGREGVFERVARDRL